MTAPGQGSAAHGGAEWYPTRQAPPADMRTRTRVRVRETGNGTGGRRREGGLDAVSRRRSTRCASRKSGAATDRARDTSQIDVAALHERDRTVTERLHGAGACQGGMRLSTPVSHSGRRPTSRGAARSETGTGAIREPRCGGRESRIPPRRPLVRCEAHHETSVRPAPFPVRRPPRRARGPALRPCDIRMAGTGR